MSKETAVKELHLPSIIQQGLAEAVKHASEHEYSSTAVRTTPLLHLYHNPEFSEKVVHEWHGQRQTYNKTIEVLAEYASQNYDEIWKKAMTATIEFWEHNNKTSRKPEQPTGKQWSMQLDKNLPSEYDLKNENTKWRSKISGFSDYTAAIQHTAIVQARVAFIRRWTDIHEARKKLSELEAKNLKNKADSKKKPVRIPRRISELAVKDPLDPKSMFKSRKEAETMPITVSCFQSITNPETNKNGANWITDEDGRQIWKLNGLSKIPVKSKKNIDARILSLESQKTSIGKKNRMGIRSWQLVETTKKINRNTKPEHRKFALRLQIQIPVPEMQQINPETSIGVDRGIVATIATDKPIAVYSGQEPSHLHSRTDIRRIASLTNPTKMNKKTSQELERKLQEADPVDIKLASDLRRAKLEQTRARNGSRKHKKAVLKERATQRKITAKAEHWEANLAHKLADSHSLIALENLEVKNMKASNKGTKDAPGKNVKQKTGLNRSISQARWASLQNHIERQAQRTGTHIEAVSPQHTSMTCSACGEIDAENRESQAVFVCKACGYQANADINAARVVCLKAEANHGISDFPNAEGFGEAALHVVSNGETAA